MKKIVVLSGAGISEESGLSTFRSSTNGLWNNYSLDDVCTGDAWDRNPKLVNEFYNARRDEANAAVPNKAHIALAEAEKYFDIHIITTNVDNLHEKAGSTKVLHLHGELNKARSSNPALDWMDMSSKPLEPHICDVPEGGLDHTKYFAPDDYPLRPFVVFFGESVPLIGEAEDIMKDADMVIVVGTSLNVYPAAGLVHSSRHDCLVYYIDTHPNIENILRHCFPLQAKATVGVPALLDELVLKFIEPVNGY